MIELKKKFAVGDIFQQIVGGFILSGAFVVTEEVWRLARNMSNFQAGLTVLIVFIIGYGALYQADPDRNPDKESRILVIPLRFISLILVSYLSVTILTFTFAAPETFGASSTITLRVIAIGAIFSVVGAATADSLL